MSHHTSMSDKPVFEEVPQPEYHDECGHNHFRWQECPPKNEPCGSYLCCIN